MATASKAKILLQIEDATINVAKLIVPSGEYPLGSIRSASLQTKKPLIGPVSLALIGTVILGMAWSAQSLMDIVVAMFLLGAGLFWYIGGVQHLLMVRTEGNPKDEAIWFTRKRASANMVLAVLQEQIEKHRNKDSGELSA
jgi:hypothetical protein